MKDYSVVIPIHNESENLERLLMSFWHNIGSLQEKVSEILLIENGSTDTSLDVCKRIVQKNPSVVRAHTIPFPSYGEAVKQGIKRSSGDIVCILEIDAMDVEFFSSSLDMIEKNEADFVVASKRHPKSIDCRPFKRRVLTYLFNKWLKLYFRFPGSDTHGLKTIRTEVAKSLCEASITGEEIFQTELVLLAHRMGFRVAELPFILEEVRNTKVSLRKRFPKIIHVIKALKESLDRFPDKTFK